jgi:hypothetical protein
MTRTLILSALLPISALAQLRLYQFDGTTETPVGQIYDIGSAAPGGNIETRFRVRNPGVASVSLTNLSLAGASFSFSAKPSLPYVVAPGSLVDFKILFSPTSTGTSSATLLVNSISVTLRGTAASAVVQLQLFQFDGTTERPVGQLYDVGTAAPGDNIETRFRVRNPGVASVSLTNLSAAGTSFRLSAQPSLPYIIAPSSFADFKVMFSPTDPGSYSANLLVNTVSVSLHGTAVAGAVLTLGPTTLTAGALIDFGQTEPGTSLPLTLTLSNPSSTSVSIASIAVTGRDFSGPVGASAPLVLAPGQSLPFTIKFAPSGPQSSQGTLTVDQRSFNLLGLGVNPPLPKASMQFDTSAGISARQAKISIQLASSSRVPGTGSLTMEFKSNIQGVADDPAIQFLSGPKRNATVTIGVGESIAKFGSSVDLTFQTGTTAGTIVFTLKLPNDTQQATFVIPPARVYFDLTTATRRVSDLDVSLIGFDNTHSASQLTFTFYDSSGRVLQPGVIRVDATADFKRYFDSNVAGGSFALRATFPVTGGAMSLPVTDATNTSPIKITTSKPHGFHDGDIVIVSSVNGNTNANGNWNIANVTSTSFTLSGSYGNGSYVGGSGTVTGDTIQVAGVDVEMTNTAGVTKTQRIQF